MTTPASVLLVEDDQSLLDGISDLLEVVDLGYQLSVSTASNGQDGLKILADHVPDLIISDIMMPKMGGFEFLDYLRQNPAWVHVPVIFLSARGSREDIRAGRISGAELYITKPFDNEELLEMVKSQLDRTFELKFDRDRRLENLQRDIIQLLNHEFRTPLTYVTAYYEMLEDGLANQNIENIRDYLRGIQTGAVRMTRLIDNFVMVIGLRTGETFEQYRTKARPVDNLQELLNSVCLEWQRSTGDRVQIECQVPANLPAVFGESSYLKEILDRLMDNAVKFTNTKTTEKPAVKVSAGTQGQELYISVADNGTGFPEHVCNQLFDLFFQYNREQMEQQGSGTGLTVVKGLVELHNGRIQVDSKVNEGSTFTIYLPIYNSETAEAAVPHSQPPQAKRPATILLVEDEQFLLHGLRELLEIFECDYELRILTATNGVEGLEVLKENRPDLIVTDIMMPKMGGYELLARVRKNPALIHIPVIFLTAKGERKDELRGRAIGAEEYIIKPYDSEELLELIIKQLDRYFQVQGAIRQDFDELKRGILDLLQPDFRSPLTSVSDYSQQLATSLEDVQTETEMRDSLIGIQGASRQITQLVEDFIFLAEIHAGEAVTAFDYNARTANASIVLLETSDLVRPTAEEKGITIHQQIALDLPPIRLDYERLKSGVLRLLNLLVDYCYLYQRGSISIRTYSENNTVFLILEMVGNSFSREKVGKLQKLFSEKVVRGLELSENDPDIVVTKGIIELHKGQINIENEPGRSARFVISLPVYEEPTFEFSQE